MGLECVGQSVGNLVKREISQTEIRNIESERTLENELPYLEKTSLDYIESENLIDYESERNSYEMPHIDNEEKNFQSEENKYYSSYDDRINQTPRIDSERGEWSQERGESEFIPNDNQIKEILEKYKKDSISYKDGIPDFFDVSESTVEIDNMTENRVDNFKQCDEKCAEQWNHQSYNNRSDWTARDIKIWRQENEYSWHERNDMKTCDLVPTKINDYFGHLGGVSECKKRDAEKVGDEFDE